MIAYARRREQLKRWKESDTNKESAHLRPGEPTVTFDYDCMFMAACSSGDTKEVTRFLDEGADVNTANADGLTVLHQACIDNDLNMVKFLIERGAEIDIRDNEGWTPLHTTASCDLPEIGSYLFGLGADLVAVNNDGNLPIDLASKEEMITVLQEEMEKRAIDVEAVRRAEEELMLADANRWLMNNHVDDDLRADPRTGATPLHVAAAKGYVAVMKLLLKTDLDVNAQDYEGWTPFHAAVYWEEEECCKLLAAHQCDMDRRTRIGHAAMDMVESDTEMEFLLEDLKDEQLGLNGSSDRRSSRRRRRAKHRRSSKGNRGSSDCPDSSDHGGSSDHGSSESDKIISEQGHGSKKRSSIIRKSMEEKHAISKSSEEDRATVEANMNHTDVPNEEVIPPSTVDTETDNKNEANKESSLTTDTQPSGRRRSSSSLSSFLLEQRLRNSNKDEEDEKTDTPVVIEPPPTPSTPPVLDCESESDSSVSVSKNKDESLASSLISPSGRRRSSSSLSSFLRERGLRDSNKDEEDEKTDTPVVIEPPPTPSTPPVLDCESESDSSVSVSKNKEESLASSLISPSGRRRSSSSLSSFLRERGLRNSNKDEEDDKKNTPIVIEPPPTKTPVLDCKSESDSSVSVSKNKDESLASSLISPSGRRRSSSSLSSFLRERRLRNGNKDEEDEKTDTPVVIEPSPTPSTPPVLDCESESDSSVSVSKNKDESLASSLISPSGRRRSSSSLSSFLRERGLRNSNKDEEDEKTDNSVVIEPPPTPSTPPVLDCESESDSSVSVSKNKDESLASSLISPLGRRRSSSLLSSFLRERRLRNSKKYEEDEKTDTPVVIEPPPTPSTPPVLDCESESDSSVSVSKNKDESLASSLISDASKHSAKGLVSRSVSVPAQPLTEDKDIAKPRPRMADTEEGTVRSWRQGLRKIGSSSMVHEKMNENEDGSLHRSASSPRIVLDNRIENDKLNFRRPAFSTSALNKTTTSSSPSSDSSERSNRSDSQSGQTPYRNYTSRTGYRPFFMRQQELNEKKEQEQGAPTPFGSRLNRSASAVSALTTPSCTTTTTTTTSASSSTVSTSIVTSNPSSITTSVFRRPYEPPKRDEETETQRKARAKHARQTRRSTQGVSLEDIEMAEKVLRQTDTSKNQSEHSVSTPSSSVQDTQQDRTTTGSTSSSSETSSSTCDKSLARSLSRNDSLRNEISLYRLRNLEDQLNGDSISRTSYRRQREQQDSALTNGASTSLDATSSYVPRSQRNLLSSADSSTSSVNNIPGLSLSRSASLRNRLRNGETEPSPSEDTKKEPKATRHTSSGEVVEKKENASSRARRKRIERRSTGRLIYDPDDLEKSKEDQTEDEEKEEEEEENTSRLGRYSSSDVPSDSTARSRPISYSEQSRSTSNLDEYRKLYEDEKEENGKLRKELEQCKKELLEAKADLDRTMRQSDTSRSTDSSDKREKRALERKVSEYEEELKKLELLKSDNNRLKEENGALIRVISKLSK